MPELCRFYGIVIKMFFNDAVTHYKPHVHVEYNEYEASIGIDGEILEGNLPRKAMRLVDAWLAIHEEELYKAWAMAVRGQSVEKIEPLK